MSIDYFGYLNRDESYVFDGGRINVLEHFQNAKEWVAEYTNKDGFLYPPVQKTFIVDPLTMERKEEVLKTERPALLYKLPPSHSVEIYGGNSIEDDRKGPSAFLIHLLGYITGYRLQFHDWWVDGRVAIKENNGLFAPKDTIEHFLSHCFRVWKSWEAENQQLVTNLLYMFSRSPHYEWDWEQFAVDYMVIDGLWRLSSKLDFVSGPCPHAERIIKLCEAYGIPDSSTHTKEIVRLRNDLFHETLWDGGQPGSAGSNNAFYETLFLRNLIMRIIPALFDYKTYFVKTSWWYFGWFVFDKAV